MLHLVGAAYAEEVPSTTSVDPVTVEPASAEQEALDASYKSGESPYDITTVGAIQHIVSEAYEVCRRDPVDGSLRMSNEHTILRQLLLALRS